MVQTNSLPWENEAIKVKTPHILGKQFTKLAKQRKEWQVVHACNASIWKTEQEDQKFMAIFCYKVSSKPVQTTVDIVSNKMNLNQSNKYMIMDFTINPCNIPKSFKIFYSVTPWRKRWHSELALSYSLTCEGMTWTSPV